MVVDEVSDQSQVDDVIEANEDYSALKKKEIRLFLKTSKWLKVY